MLIKWSTITDNQTSITKGQAIMLDTFSYLQSSRISQNVTRKQISKAMGVKLTRIRRLENMDTSIPSFVTIYQYAHALGIKISVTLTQNNKEPKTFLNDNVNK